MKNIYLISLGCDKNLVDSEVMLGLLSKSGYTITNDLQLADYVIVNTCCFIGDAKEESINTIIELGELKKEGKLRGIIVSGCLAERYKEEIHRELPEVDVVIGTTAYDKIVTAIDSIEDNIEKIYLSDINKLVDGEDYRITPIGEISSYIKIAEGCDKRCTYCIIPYVRGNYRSMPMDKILKEATNLAKNGTKELILVAQETTMYGIDLYKKKSLSILLSELAKIDGIDWIRLLYCYPEEITDEIIESIKNIDKVCKYIDMPIQHSSDNILRRMGRRTNKAEIKNKIEKLRREIPGIAIRTTLITGFPGETEDDFIDLYNFVEEMEFERLGVFTYSAEEGTPAATMQDQVDEETKTRRRNEIMELQQEISEENARKLIGRRLSVLVEGLVSRDSIQTFSNLAGENIYIGRSYMDAPDVDGQVFFESDYEIISGEIVEVEVIASDKYDVFGVLV